MYYQWKGDDLLLNIRVQPRASSDGFAEELGDRVKLKITAPPVDGKANKHLIAFIAKPSGLQKPMSASSPAKPCATSVLKFINQLVYRT